MGAGWIGAGAPPPPDAGEPRGASEPLPPPMSSQFEAAGPDTPMSANLMEPTGSDEPAAAALARPHQDTTAHPIQNTHSLMDRARGALTSAGDAVERGAHAVAGAYRQGTELLGSGEAAGARGVAQFATEGPAWSTVGGELPHAFGAEVSNIEAGAKEGYGAWQSHRAAQQVAALNVLPQVAARTPANTPDQQVAAMAADPLVAKTARTLGISPQDFAAQWNRYRDYTDDERSVLAQQAQAKLTRAQQLEQAGTQQRREALASEQKWTPKDVAGNPIDPWSLKGIAFHAATALPDMVAIAGSALGTGLVTGPVGGAAAGAGTAVALLAPQQYAGIQNRIDQRLDQLKTAAANARTGAARDQALQAAADLSTNRNKIAQTATILYGVSDVAGSLPVASVLARMPGGRAVLNRIVGATLAKTVGGRIAGIAVVNGAGAAVQTALQKGIDTGVIHEQQPLKDALKDIAYSGVIGAITGAGLGAVHEAAVGPVAGIEGRAARGRAQGEQILRSYQPDQRLLPAPTEEAGGPIGPAAPAPQPAPETPAEQPQTGAPAARRDFQRKVAIAQDAAARAQNRSDVQLEERDGEHHIVVDGESVASFGSKATAQEVLAQARKMVGSAPAAASAASGATETPAKEPEPAPQAPAPAAVARHPITQLPDHTAYEAAPKQPTQMVVRPDDVDFARESGDENAAHAILRTVAHALPENSYHLEGDRFVVQAASRADAEQKLDHVRNALTDSQFTIRTPEGEEIPIQGVDLSHGIGDSLEQAERARGAVPEEPAGQGASEGRQTGEREVAAGSGSAGARTGAAAPERTARVLGQEVSHAEPTAAQAEAGNYKHPTIPWHGLTLAVENLPGSVRRYTGPDGEAGQRTMKDAYGYVRGENGADREGLDVFMGHDPDASHVYVVDQVRPDGKFDEHKALIGYGSLDEAKKAYRRNYQSGWKGLGAITELSPDAFKHWVAHGDLTKPLALTRKGKTSNVEYIKRGHQLAAMAQNAGWHEIGGRGKFNPETGIGIGVVPYVPKEPWFRTVQKRGALPGNNGGEATRRAVEKAIAGKPLGERERRHLDEMLVAARAMHATPEELKALTPEQLAEHEQLLHEFTRTGVGEELKLYGGAMPREEAKKPEAGQPDLFGNRREIANQLERVRAEMARRQREAPPVESGERPDLFNSSAKQTEIDVGDRRAAYSDELKSELSAIKQRHGLQDLEAHITPAGDLHLDLIRVPKGQRKQGLGTAAMRELVRYADARGLRMTLDTAVHTPGETTSSGRLRAFYKRFGFVRNFGRAKDFAISASMYRDARTGTMAGPGGVGESSRLAYQNTQLQLNFGHGPQTVTPKFETRPGTTPAQVEVGAAFLKSVIAFGDRRAGARVLGNRLTRDFVDQGHTRLVGQVVRSPADLALLAQVYRDPRVETLRVFFVKDGKVVDQFGLSSRMPGAVSFSDPPAMIRRIEEMKSASGADTYYLLHNHPSGSAQPSGPDVNFTAAVDRVLPGLRAHVVIDHNEYGLIKPDGADAYVVKQDFGGYEIGQNPALNHPMLGFPLTGPKMLAIAAKALKRHAEDPNRAVVIATDSQGRVAVIADLPIPMVESTGKWRLGGKGTAARLRRIRAAGGAGGYVFAVTASPERLMRSYRMGLFADVIGTDGTPSAMQRSERLFASAHIGGLLERARTSLREETNQYGGPFYSALTRAIEGARRERGTAAEWIGTLKNMPGVKREELEYTDLENWLAGRGRVSKNELLDYARAHEIYIQEVVHGAAMPATQEGLAARKAIFDKYAPQIEELDKKALDYTHPDREDARDRSMLLQAKRDLEADQAYTIPEDTEGQFPQYALPGGSRYRELLLTLPPKPVQRERHGYIQALPNGLYLVRTPGLQDKAFPTQAEAEAEVARNTELFGRVKQDENYRSPHWSGVPNVLAHVRFDERIDAEGRRALHLAEVQSDWHQSGRKHGYLSDDPKAEAARREFEAYSEELGQKYNINPELNIAMFATLKGIPREEVERYDQLQRAWLDTRPDAKAVPDAPYKTTWPELAMKRMLRFAAEHGYDRLTWDTGDTNAERYSLSHKIGELYAERMTRPDGRRGYYLTATDQDGGVIQRAPFGRMYWEDSLPELLGKDLAEKIAGQPEGEQSYRGLDLKVGGSGMRAFYDQMLPSIVGKLTKKFGGKVGVSKVRTDNAPPEVVARYADQPDHPFTKRQSAEVHSLDITPELAAHVMRGQAVFDERAPYGSEDESAPKYGEGLQSELDLPKEEKPPANAAYGLARRAVAAIPNNELALEFRRILDPAGISEESERTASLARESLGELAQASHEAIQRLEAFSRQFDLLSPDDRLAFIHAVETGSPSPFAPGAAEVIRSILDGWRDKVRSLGVGALDRYIENYFPHIWADADKAKKVFGQMVGRRPLKGPATFLKQRSIPTMADGIAMGLKPLTTNPLTLTFLKAREMQRFYMGVKLMQKLRDEKLAVFLPSSKPMPEGWAEINDAVGRVRQWSEAEQGFIERGRYIMPADAARVINNHLSPSWLQQHFASTTGALRTVTNMANALQLGFSAFHLGFTTLDAVISKNALAIERLAHGQPIAAMRALLEAATGPGAAVANVMRGARLARAYADFGQANPEMRKLVRALIAAGGRAKVDNYYLASRGQSPFKGVGVRSLAQEIRQALTLPHGRVVAVGKTLTSFPGQYALRMWRDLQAMAVELPRWQIPFEIAGRITRASTALIMEHIVPLQKLGVFSDLASDYIRRNPEADPIEFAKAMQSIWNSVDNRLGEMVYDDLFWNRTFKDIMHLTVRAVGWNLGTIREIGGAPVDVVKLMDWAAGKGGLHGESIGKFGDALGHKIPYVIALVVTTGLLGAITQYLMTGKGPQQPKDYFFPRTGALTKYGTPERVSLPSYLKDIYEYAQSPVGTLINKANPIFGVLHSIYANEDFYGNAVRNDDDPWYKQLWESVAYAAKEVAPFSLQGSRQFKNGGALRIAPYVGVSPAPARVTSPAQMAEYEHRENEQSYLRTLNRELRDALQRGDKRQVDLLRVQIRAERLKERQTSRDIRRDKARAAAEKIGALLKGKSRAEGLAAVRAAGYPAMADLLEKLPPRPRPRVANALSSFV